jgi:glycosyltransferase involved in cell wall biosynthesis
VGVGRLVEKKGFVDLIEACAILADEGRTFTCQIVGTGEKEVELRMRIAHLGLEDRVELLGPRPQSELVRLVHDAAVLAAPCVVGADGNRDGLPTVLLEAMALGTPCVSTDVTGIPEVIRGGETGLVVSQGDPGALAAAIGRLLQETDLRVRLADRARRLVEAKFDVNRNAAQLREVFQSADKAHYARAAQRAF